MNNNLNLVYASVLFDIARKNNKISLFLEYAQKLLFIINNQPKFILLINDLNISKKERKNIIQDIWLHSTHIDFIHFLWSIIDFNRTRDLKIITQHFLHLCQEHLHISYFQVTSSYPLSKTELSHLQKAIAQKFHKHNITINNVVDPTIIGGIKIKSNSHSIDETLKNKLMLMRENVVSGGSTRR